MPAVEHRNGKKVYEPDAYRNYSRELNEIPKTHRGDLLGHAGHPDRSPQPAHVHLACDHLPDRGQGAMDNEPDALDRGANRFQRTVVNDSDFWLVFWVNAQRDDICLVLQLILDVKE